MVGLAPEKTKGWWQVKTLPQMKKKFHAVDKMKKYLRFSQQWLSLVL
jgi:hypothetical protein